MSFAMPSRGARHLRAYALAVMLGLALIGHASSSDAASGPGARSADRSAQTCRVDYRLVPTCPGVLSGAYVSPHSGENYSLATARFERQSDARADVLHFYYRGDRMFPNADETAALSRGPGTRTLFAAWKPDDGYTWRQVANGAADARLIREAAYLRAHWTWKMFLTVHHEPENEVKDWPGSGYEAADYRAMFRHVEDVFDASGVTNVVWVMNYMGAQKWALASWYDDLWPGWRYADWIAFDPYKTSGLGGQDGGFASLVNQHWGSTSWRGAYRWAHQNHPYKPVMLAEWGIGERADQPSWKADFFRGIASRLDRFPRLKALIYFDNDAADVAGDVSVDTSTASLLGFRDFLSSGVVANIR